MWFLLNVQKLDMFQLQGGFAPLTPDQGLCHLHIALLILCHYLMLRSALTKFHQTAKDLGLHIWWQKTNVQNLDSGDFAADITVANNTIEAVTEFQY